MRVMGRTPRFLCSRTSASTLPAPLARSNAFDHGLSIR